MKIAFVFLAAWLTISTPLAQARPTPPPLTNSPATTAPLDPAAATHAWLETVPAEKRAQSDAYFEGGYWLILWNFLLGAAISILLLESGLSTRLRDFAERTTRSPSLQVVLYPVPYVIIVAALSFPLGVYSGFFREHAYGLAAQTFGPWFREQVIALAVSIVATALVMLALYAVFRRARRTWWLWGTAVGVPWGRWSRRF
jgi:CAAX prenyl protease-like protein